MQIQASDNRCSNWWQILQHCSNLHHRSLCTTPMDVLWTPYGYEDSKMIFSNKESLYWRDNVCSILRSPGQLLIFGQSSTNASVCDRRLVAESSALGDSVRLRTSKLEMPTAVVQTVWISSERSEINKALFNHHKRLLIQCSILERKEGKQQKRD